MAGDFNAICDWRMDKKTMEGKKTKSSHARLPDTFFKLVNTTKLVDTWKMLNPSSKAFTYFSHPHKSHSRIDMVWASSDLLIQTKEINIHPRTVTDHNPLEWKINERGKKEVLEIK